MGRVSSETKSVLLLDADVAGMTRASVLRETMRPGRARIDTLRVHRARDRRLAAPHALTLVQDLSPAPASGALLMRSTGSFRRLALGPSWP